MAFPDHNWTITHNANKSYTVSCSNFIEQTKSITLTTANKNFTGDVSINITCANCGDKSVSGIESSSGVAIDTSDLFSSTYNVYASGTMTVSIAESGWIQKGNYDLPYTSYKIGTIYKGTTPSLIGNSETSEVGLSTNGSLNYITVSNSETITAVGATPGYYLANAINGEYSISSHSVGKIPKNNLKSLAYIYDSRIGGSNDRNLAILYPESIYVVLNDGTDFYISETGPTIWSEPGSWEGGSIVWFDGSVWRIKSHNETGYSDAYCLPDPGQTYKTCYLDANNYIRRIRIANRVTSGISTVDESISGDGARIRVTSY